MPLPHEDDDQIIELQARPHPDLNESSNDKNDSITNTSPLANNKPKTSLLTRLRTFHSTHIRPSYRHERPGHPSHDPRDYLALERTYLAWLRTSLGLVNVGVVVTQLYVLRNRKSALPSPSPSQSQGSGSGSLVTDANKTTTGKALGCVFHAFGIVLLAIGASRYFRQQALLGRGKIDGAGVGWEMGAVLIGWAAVLVGLFVVIVVLG